MNAKNRINEDHQAAHPHVSQIGPRIVGLRDRRGWSQRDLACRAGLLPSRLSKLERALRPPKLDELLRLAEALEVSLEELAFGGPPRQTRWLELVRELETLGTPEEVAGMKRILQLLLLGYRAAADRQPEGDLS